jgi:hypothetical protein
MRLIDDSSECNFLDNVSDALTFRALLCSTDRLPSHFLQRHIRRRFPPDQAGDPQQVLFDLLQRLGRERRGGRDCGQHVDKRAIGGSGRSRRVFFSARGWSRCFRWPTEAGG